MKRQTVAEWLAKHVERAGEGECWPAHGGGYNKRGWHVTFKAEGKRHMAHRAAWEQVNGPIPAGMCILHKCDNPKCCNPEHLALGTQSDNAKDMWRKKRGRVTGDSRRGVRLGPSPHRRLTPEQVSAVFEKYSQGWTQKAIAAELGVTDVTVSKILRGRTYPELADRASEVKHLLGRGTKRRKNKCN